MSGPIDQCDCIDCQNAEYPCQGDCELPDACLGCLNAMKNDSELIAIYNQQTGLNSLVGKCVNQF